MSTLDEQIAELTVQRDTIKTQFDSMTSSTSTATSDQQANVYNQWLETDNLLQSAIAIKNSQIDASTTLKDSYSSAVDAYNAVNAISQQSSLLAASTEITPDTKKRMVDNNKYYGETYSEYKNLFVSITIVAACMIATLLLAYTPLEFLSRPMTIAVFIIGVAYISYKLILMLLRSNINYSEFNWLATPITDDGIAAANNDPNKIIDVSGIKLGVLCAGPLCCGEGTIWDNDKGCVLANS